MRKAITYLFSILLFAVLITVLLLSSTITGKAAESSNYNYSISDATRIQSHIAEYIDLNSDEFKPQATKLTLNTHD